MEQILTLADCQVIIDNLLRGRDAMTHYSYHDESQRQASMKPVNEALDKVRSIRDSLKEPAKRAMRVKRTPPAAEAA